MIGRFINLPFKVIGAVARAVQDKNDAAMRARHGEGVDTDNYDHLAGKDLAEHELPSDYDPGNIEIGAAAVRADQRAGKELVFLDVRSEADFAREHLPDAMIMPMGQLAIRLAELPPNVRVVVYCADGGVKSQRATAFLRYRGLEDSWRLTGGLPAWKSAGGSLTRS